MTVIKEPATLTGMTKGDWDVALGLFDAAQSRQGEPGRDHRKLLEILHYFTVHNLTWQASPTEYGNWNSVWKRLAAQPFRGVRGVFPASG